MTTHLPVYRATVYAPRSISNPNETAVLSPSGAWHSEDFKVASAQGISGFQPYIVTIPKGRKSRLDSIKKKLDIGAITLKLGDKRQNTSTNLNRWVTAFIGDSTGKNRMLGLKCYVEESLDGGSTFSSYYVGRITEFPLDGLLKYKITIKEENSLLKRVKVFGFEPSGSVLAADNLTDGYSNRRMFLPLGPEKKYGPIGTVGIPFGVWGNSRSGRNRVINVSITDANIEDGKNWVVKPLLETFPEYGGDDADRKETEYGYGPIVEVFSAGTIGRFIITYADLVSQGGGISSLASKLPFLLKGMLLEEIPGDAYRKGSFSDFGLGNIVFYKILDNREISEKSPLLSGNVHPVQYWKDMLKGSFSLLDTNGDAIFRDTFDIAEASFSALIADTAIYKDARFMETKELDMDKAITTRILQPYNLAYRMEPTESAGVGVNVIVPFSMGLPATTAGIPTITEDALVAGSKPTWEPGEPFVSFETKYYQDRKKPLQDLDRGNDDNASLMTSGPIYIKTLDIDNVHAGEGIFKIDAQGMRFFPFEFFVDVIRFPFLFSRSRVIGEQAQAFHNENVYRWSRGPAKVSIKARRSGSVETTQIGDWRLLDIAYIPGEFGHVRGETRLAQCIERTENGPNLTLRFVDSGRNVQTATPTVGTFNQVANTNSVSGTVEVTTALRVEGGFAVTEQSIATRPDTTSSAWDISYRQIQLSGSTDVVLGQCPNGARIWPRFRSWTVSPDELELPSDWAYPSNDFVDIAAMNPPTNLIASEITQETARMTWVNGEATASVELKIKPADSSSFTRVAFLVAGSTQFALTNLSPSASVNPYEASVGHIDQWGGASATASVSFTCTGAAVQQCPLITGITIVSVEEDTREIA